MEEQKNNQTAVEVKTEDETQYDEIQKVKQVERTDSYFDGKVLEWLGYRILAFIITAVTFGIANAWAEKLLIAYTIDHTVYNGKRLKFEGTGASLFVQKFKWIFLTIITLGIYGFWISIKKEQWIVSNIHFEKEEFVKGDSYFDGGVLGIIGVNLFSNILTFISFGLLFPFVVCYRQKWFAKHTIINRKKIVFTGKSLNLIGNYLLWWFLCIITFGIFGLWLPIKIEYESKYPIAFELSFCFTCPLISPSITRASAAVAITFKAISISPILKAVFLFESFHFIYAHTEDPGR